VGRLDHDLGAANIRGERTERMLDNELDPHRRRQVDHNIALVDELVDHQLIEHRSLDETALRMPTCVIKIGKSPGREGVESNYPVTTGQ